MLCLTLSFFQFLKFLTCPIYQNYEPNITYIIDHEINNKGIKVLPNKHYYVDDLNIHTLLSSDKGVAFIIEIGNKRIYHAGDLHWWHWIGEPDSDNNYQANTFKSEINKIKDLNFDLMIEQSNRRHQSHVIKYLHSNVYQNNLRVNDPFFQKFLF